MLAPGFLAGPAGAGSLEIEAGPPPEPLPLAQEKGSATVSIPEGLLALYGRLHAAGFAVEQVGRVSAADDKGQPLLLYIETESLFEEFGQIVGLWCVLLVPADQVAQGERFTLHWGSPVDTEIEAVPRLVFEPSQRDRVLGFSPAAFAAGPGQEMPLTSIRVIADSAADYRFLWYLVPILVLFVLLIARKLRAHALGD